MPGYYIRRLLVEMLDVVFFWEGKEKDCGVYLYMFVRASKFEVVSSGVGSPYGQ